MSAESCLLELKALLSVSVFEISELERCFYIKFQKLVGFVLIDRLVRSTYPRYNFFD